MRKFYINIIVLYIISVGLIMSFLFIGSGFDLIYNLFIGGLILIIDLILVLIYTYLKIRNIKGFFINVGIYIGIILLSILSLNLIIFLGKGIITNVHFDDNVVTILPIIAIGIIIYLAGKTGIKTIRKDTPIL